MLRTSHLQFGLAPILLWVLLGTLGCRQLNESLLLPPSNPSDYRNERSREMNEDPKLQPNNAAIESPLDTHSQEQGVLPSIENSAQRESDEESQNTTAVGTDAPAQTNSSASKPSTTSPRTFLGDCDLEEGPWTTAHGGCMHAGFKLVFSAISNQGGKATTIEAPESNNHCQQLSESGFTDWRLPKELELKRLVGEYAMASLGFLDFRERYNSGNNLVHLLPFEGNKGIFHLPNETIDVYSTINLPTGMRSPGSSPHFVFCVRDP